jgi:pimeloyl-ACP methyl ester carboxylesterase
MMVAARIARGALLMILAASVGCAGRRLSEGPASTCTHVQAVREVRGAAVCEDVWTCGRPPGGRFDRLGLRRLALCEGARGPVVLYLPGMHMNGRVPSTDARHDLRLYLTAAGVRTWGLDYRTHAVPPEATPADLEALAAWTASVFTEDAMWAAGFVRNADPGPLYLAGFSYGAGLAYRVAAGVREPVAGLVILDGASGGSRPRDGSPVAIDVGGQRLPFEERKRLLRTVMTDPDAASPVPGYESAGDALAEILHSSSAFGGNGGLSAARAGVSDVQVVARLLATYDRWWPRAALDAAPPAAPGTRIPVVAFATTNMGREWVERVRTSATSFGGEQTSFRELPGYGHLDVLVGRRAAQEVFEPVRAWLLR